MLKKILLEKKLEVAAAKEHTPVQDLEAQSRERARVSLKKTLESPGLHIIAEIKYRSPSHGPFACQDRPAEIASQYLRSGASALSILTDGPYFGGSLRNLEVVYKHLQENEVDDTDPGEETPDLAPLLRKDFVIDRYQIAEAGAYGASAYLLIVAALDPSSLRRLIEHGRDAGLDPLVEVHDEGELETAVESGATLIGVNNRDLRTFQVDIQTSFNIARRLEGESGFTLVAESGLSEPVQLEELHDAGFQAFLIGTAFMDSKKPGEKMRYLLEAARSRLPVRK